MIEDPFTTQVRNTGKRRNAHLETEPSTQDDMAAACQRKQSLERNLRPTLAWFNRLTPKNN